MTSLDYVLPTIVAASFGAVFVDREYYKKIQNNTPFWTPPPFIFGLMWTIIYIIIIYVYTYIPDYYWLFIVTLFFNAIWTPLFFKLKLKWLSLIVIIIMALLAVFTYGKLEEMRIQDIDNSSIIEILMYLFFIYIVWLFVATSLTVCSLFFKDE